jgi:hypothetical protein
VRFGVLVLLAGCRLGFDESTPQRDSGSVIDGLSQTSDASGASDGTQLACPGTYAAVGGLTSKYRGIDNSMGWLTSEQLCEGDGTHLVVIDNAAELTAIPGLLPGQNIWTGTTDRLVIGTFHHVTGANATFLDWDSSEPDATALECVFIDALTVKLGDQDCGSGRRAVCECDGLAVDPSSY